MSTSERARSRYIDRLTDGELMRRVQCADDTSAFGALYERHCSRAAGLARRICSSCEAGCAAEAVQEGFLAVWRSREDYLLDRGPVQAWILVLVRNRAVDILRQPGRKLPTSHAPEVVEQLASTYRVEDEVESQDEGRLLRQRLGDLPATQREVIELAFFDGLTHREIAATLGLPQGTIKGRMRLGFQKLRIPAATEEPDCALPRAAVATP